MSRADLNQSDIVKALRSVGASVEITNQQKNGFPDLCVGIFGKNYLIEVKNKVTRGKLTPDQEIFIDKWKGKIFIVETPDEALRVIGVQV
jgi:hypothetical protein